MNVLVVADPRRLAGDAIPQPVEPAARRRVQDERHELRREDDPPDAEPMPGGLAIDFQQQGREGLEVDPTVVALAPMVELEPVAERVPRPRADLGRVAAPGPERHEHVHRHPVLVRAVRPEPPSPWPAGLAHDEPAPALGPRPRGEGGQERVAHAAVYVLPAQRRPEERVRDVPRSPRRDHVRVLDAPPGNGAEDARRRVSVREDPHPCDGERRREGGHRDGRDEHGEPESRHARRFYRALALSVSTPWRAADRGRGDRTSFRRRRARSARSLAGNEAGAR
ncbi:hypothetical protein Adeh_2297 [Anaeromyxobacter dehalogenans 2CP-C]|uniref:Uncharacterized protein n=1 Tax=Anaeromyxobacter dehalogenans (strain 2CP-C) TaxID=290397 RepID=Q2IK85_ANADE|nr:hypothetical protein Adeh_2297 [Anaeromyxobacter dehalogenans 2CP-C]